jgi:hypothetical protein
MTDLGRGFLVTVLTVLLVLGSVSAWDKADRPAQFEVVADAVSGPDTLGLSVADEPIKAVVVVVVVVYFHGVTSLTAGSRQLLFTRLARDGPVQPVGGCGRRVRQPGRHARIVGT